MADLDDLDDTPEAVEAERDRLREGLAEGPPPPHTSPHADAAGGGEAPAGKSPDEIAQGKHLAP